MCLASGEGRVTLNGAGDPWAGVLGSSAGWKGKCKQNTSALISRLWSGDMTVFSIPTALLSPLWWTDLHHPTLSDGKAHLPHVAFVTHLIIATRKCLPASEPFGSPWRRTWLFLQADSPSGGREWLCCKMPMPFSIPGRLTGSLSTPWTLVLPRKHKCITSLWGQDESFPGHQ